jgi:hypothetical protein
MTDPIDGILRPYFRMRLYVIFTLVASASVTALSYMSKVFGRSVSFYLLHQPMLTCFIRTEFDEISQTITLILFFMIPVALFSYSIYLSLTMCCNRKLFSDRNLTTMFYKYMSLIISYFFLNIPMLLLYILTIKVEIQRQTFYSWLSFTSAIVQISIPLLITLLRICQGFLKIDVLSLCKKITIRKSLDNTNKENLIGEDFQNLEKSVLETVSFNRLLL